MKVTIYLIGVVLVIIGTVFMLALALTLEKKDVIINS